jgi:hypothetical protein
LFQLIEKKSDFLNKEVDLKFIKIGNLNLFYILCSNYNPILFESSKLVLICFLNFTSQNETNKIIKSNYL